MYLPERTECIIFVLTLDSKEQEDKVFRGVQAAASDHRPPPFGGLYTRKCCNITLKCPRYPWILRLPVGKPCIYSNPSEKKDPWVQVKLHRFVK